MKKEVHEILESTRGVEHISALSLDKRFFGAAYSMHHGTREIVHETVFHDSGAFELIMPEGYSYLFAYRDINSNLIYDADEPAGQYGGPN